jgi:cell division protein FtsI/penicillin-binding protein 2
MAGAQESAIFAQGTSAVLERQFGRGDLTWLLVDRSARVLTQQWPKVEEAIAPGSLLKPFLASAYGEQYNARYPRLLCSGTADHCWYPRGHGEVGLEEALAQSCNAYFLHLAENLDEEQINATCTRYGLRLPRRKLSAEDRIGLTSVWRETPLSIARAYLALLEDQGAPSRVRIMAGMKAAAQDGTARGASVAFASQDLLAKTGTASCLHRPQATADGFAVLLYPATTPRFLLLVRQHAATGAEASKKAGAMLRAIGLGVS